MNTYKLSRKKVRLLKKQKLQILMMVIYAGNSCIVMKRRLGDFLIQILPSKI